MLITAEELAEELKVPISWVREKTSRKLIPHYKLGLYCRYDPSEVRNHFKALPKKAEVKLDGKSQKNTAAEVTTKTRTKDYGHASSNARPVQFIKNNQSKHRNEPKKTVSSG